MGHGMHQPAQYLPHHLPDQSGSFPLNDPHHLLRWWKTIDWLMLLFLLRKKYSSSFAGISMCSTSARLLISCAKTDFSVQLISDFKSSIFDEHQSFRRVREGTGVGSIITWIVLTNFQGPLRNLKKRQKNRIVTGGGGRIGNGDEGRKSAGSWNQQQTLTKFLLMLSHVLRSTWNVLGHNCWGCPYSLTRTNSLWDSQYPRARETFMMLL